MRKEAVGKDELQPEVKVHLTRDESKIRVNVRNQVLAVGRFNSGPLSAIVAGMSTRFSCNLLS